MLRVGRLRAFFSGTKRWLPVSMCLFVFAPWGVPLSRAYAGSLGPFPTPSSTASLRGEDV